MLNLSTKRHALGQNFLTDQKVIDAIVQEGLRLCRFYQVGTLLEVGPGHGVLTKGLIEGIVDTHFIAIEKDKALAKKLYDKWGSVIVEKDARDDLNGLLKNYPCGVVSNLPYSSGTHILLSLAQNPNIHFFLVMLQKEVTERILEGPGTKGSNSLAIVLQNRFEIQLFLKKVGPEAFSPSPKVSSAVILLVRRSKPIISIEGNEQKWDGFLKKLFFAPRKIIRSKGLVNVPEEFLTKRASELSWEELRSMFYANHHFFNSNSSG